MTDEERDALIRYLRDGIERDRFPLSPRLTPIRAILDKLQQQSSPQPQAPEPQRKIVPPRAGRKRSRWPDAKP